MTFKEFVPAGAPDSSLVVSGTNLQTVTATSSTGVTPTHTYSSAAGLDRDSVGIRTVITEADDVGCAILRNTVLAAGKGRVYGCLRSAPAGTGEYQFLQLSSNTGRIIKFQIAGSAHATIPGHITVCDFAGTRLVDTGIVWDVDEVLHFYLGAQPGTTSSNGKGRAEIYDDTDVNLFTMANGNVLGGNVDALNMGTTLNVLEVAVARLTAGAGGLPLNIDWTRLASNTDGTSIPATSTLPFVAKIVPGGGFDGYGGELVYVGSGVWR